MISTGTRSIVRLACLAPPGPMAIAAQDLVPQTRCFPARTGLKSLAKPADDPESQAGSLPSVKVWHSYASPT